jgi:hypothetical protein
MTSASTLYEAIEPQILWQQLYATAKKEILDGALHPQVRPHGHTRMRAHITQALGMIGFLLTTFRSHDAEVLNIHLPVVATALAELCNVRIQLITLRISPTGIRASFLIKLVSNNHLLFMIHCK